MGLGSGTYQGSSDGGPVTKSGRGGVNRQRGRGKRVTGLTVLTNWVLDEQDKRI